MEEYRLSYAQCRELLAQRLAEPAPGRIQLLAGPRQVGKTTLLLELAEALGVDGVLEGSWGRWAVEVKTGRFEVRELAPLLEFTRRDPELRPLVLCDTDGRATTERAGVQALTWQQFLLGEPPGTASAGR